MLEDEHTPAAHAVLLRVAAEGAVVPSLWRLEVANALRNAARRARCNQDHFDRSIERLGRLPIVSDEETDLQAWGGALSLSRDEGLTPYDAAYIALAEWLDVPLLTRDRRLANAASHTARVELI